VIAQELQAVPAWGMAIAGRVIGSALLVRDEPQHPASALR
jgi:hypothetical protein